MSITLKLIFDGRRPLKKKGDAYPFRIRVTFKRQSLEFQTVYSLTKPEEKKHKASHVGGDLQKVRVQSKKCLTDAETYVNNVGEHFTWSAFIRDFINQNPGFVPRTLKSEPVTPEASEFDFGPYEKRFKAVFKEVHPGKDYISHVYSIYVKKLIRRKKISSALNYQYSYSALKKFRGNIQFEKITTEWLFEYEDWRIKKGVTITTVGIELRALRCIFNEAAAAPLKIINKANCYPFGKRGYQIPATRNTKVALSAKELKTLYDYKTDDPDKALALDYWWFLYFGNGMNLKDAALLTYDMINDGFITFKRAKTDRTGGVTTLPISVCINDDMEGILYRRSNRKVDGDTYILPILRPGLNPLEIHDTVKAHIRVVNLNVRKVFDELGLEKKSTTKVTRHSFMTQQKRNGASTEEIQEAVGHTNPMTTQFYLDSFELETKRSFAKNSSKFKETA